MKKVVFKFNSLLLCMLLFANISLATGAKVSDDEFKYVVDNLKFYDEYTILLYGGHSDALNARATAEVSDELLKKFEAQNLFLVVYKDPNKR